MLFFAHLDFTETIFKGLPGNATCGLLRLCRNFGLGCIGYLMNWVTSVNTILEMHSNAMSGGLSGKAKEPLYAPVRHDRTHRSATTAKSRRVAPAGPTMPSIAAHMRLILFIDFS
jgi:hypothetical protein